MQKLKFKFLFAAAALFIVFNCHAAIAQETVSSEKQALVRELWTVMGGQKNVNETLELMLAHQERELPNMLLSRVEQEKNLTPAQKQELKQIVTESVEGMSKRLRELFTEKLNFGQMLEEIIFEVYEKNLTDGELRELVAFYRTPTGQKMITVMPGLMVEATTKLLAKYGSKFQELIKEITEAELMRMKQKLHGVNDKKNGRKSR